ncbi:MAG: hypothetical protein GC185_02620 [Alphaproteobacteria bacterium]|nr:hypothetical protein [Alphaproteobacteria bacterium]
MIVSQNSPQNSFRLALSYARREMRAGLSGFYVFLACLVLGVGAIATIQSLSAGLTDSLRRDGRSVLGGDIALYSIYKPQAPPVAQYLKTLGRTARVLNMVAMARAEKGPKGGADATLSELKAVDENYPLYGTYSLADGRELDARALAKLLQPENENRLARRGGGRRGHGAAAPERG